MSKHHLFARAAAATLKMAKTTSDRNFAARLVERAADLKDRVDNLPPPTSEERRRVIEEYIDTQIEVLNALRKLMD